MPKPTPEQMAGHIDRLVKSNDNLISLRLKPVKSPATYANAMFAIGQRLGRQGGASPAQRAANAWEWAVSEMLAGAVDRAMRTKIKNDLANHLKRFRTDANPFGREPPPHDHVFWRLAKYGDLEQRSTQEVLAPAPPATYETLRAEVQAKFEAAPDIRLLQARHLAAGYLSSEMYRHAEGRRADKWFLAPARNVMEAVFYVLSERGTVTPTDVLRAVRLPALAEIESHLRCGNELQKALADQLRHSLELAGRSRFIVLSALATTAQVAVTKASLASELAGVYAEDEPVLDRAIGLSTSTGDLAGPSARSDKGWSAPALELDL